MANHYKRAKLAADAFRGLTSKFQSKPHPISRLISTNSSFSAPKPPTFSRFSPPYSISHNPVVPQNPLHPFFNLAGKRYYHADRHADGEWRSVGIAFLAHLCFLGLAAVTCAVFTKLHIPEGTGPYTVPFIKPIEDLRDGFEWKILPANHPESVRVRQISSEIIDALKRGLLLHEKDSRAKKYLLDLNWEVLVVDQPRINAVSFFGGKIVVFTGLLNHLESDAEVATVIGHEVAHAVALYTSETSIWRLLMYSHQRMELEADHIGLLLTASAGYDPRVAPTVYHKLSQVAGGDSALDDYISTHPSGKKRAKMLARAHIMEEALTIYCDVIAGRGI